MGNTEGVGLYGSLCCPNNRSITSSPTAGCWAELVIWGESQEKWEIWSDQVSSLLAPSQSVSPGHQPNTLHIPPRPLLWVVIKPMKAACPISALPAAAWNSSNHPCKAVAGSSPADALEDGGIQLVADELPRKPCAEGALDALTLPGASWSRPGCGLPGQILGVFARLFPAAFVTPAGTQPSWMHGEADGGAQQRQGGKENQVR